MKKNEPKKVTGDTKSKVPEKAHKDSKGPAKDSKVPAKDAKKEIGQPTKNIEPKKIVQAPEKVVQLQSSEMALGGIAAALDSKDRRCIYLIDESENSYTFFKYKGRLIDLPSLHLDIHIQQKPRQAVMEEIRKQFLFGMKQGEAIVFHIGLNELDVDDFLKGEKFWDPKNLFRSPDTFDTEWYRANIMKPDDKDVFGNEGAFFPSKDFIVFVTLSKDIPFENIKWLQPAKKEFRRIKII